MTTLGFLGLGTMGKAIAERQRAWTERGRHPCRLEAALEPRADLLLLHRP